MNKKAGELYNSTEFIYEVSEIDNSIYNRIKNKSYIENDEITLNDLIYIKFLHYH